MGPEYEEIPAGELNLASRFVNLVNIQGDGVGVGWGGIGPKNAPHY